jgi:UDP-N-acetylmuramoyl-tripeptide--D-alanyl-D-alanine ligase
MVTLDELVAAAARPVRTGPTAFPHAVVDSREVGPGDLFVALRGEHTDGHRFVGDALRRGAGGALVREVPPSVPAGGTVVQAADPLRTLWAVADRRRQRSPLRMVAVTGSVGKTTTKEWIAALLATTFVTFRTEGNRNTEIGLPLDLLELTGKEGAGVAELAMRGPGEIRMLASLVRPQVGVITNIGDSHIGRLGSREAIAHAKAELFESLPPDGVAVVPGNEPFAPLLLASAACDAWTVGEAEDDTVRARDVVRGPQGQEFTLEHAGERARARLRAVGSHHLVNALLAVAAARAVGVPLARAAEALEGLKAAPGRGQLVREEGIWLLDDSYNASPTSLRAALEVLGQVGGGRARRTLVFLGEMRELGARSRPLHRESGRMVAEAGVDLLVAVGGEDAQALLEGAREGGLEADRLLAVADAEEAAQAALAHVREGDRVLVKGARAVGMERVVRALAQWRPQMPGAEATGR